MARLLLVLVMAVGALARPQDNCEIFGDCPPPPSAFLDDELFGPEEPAGDCEDEIFGNCSPAAPPLDDELFGAPPPLDDGPEEVEDVELFAEPSNGVDPDDPYANLECFDTVNDIDEFAGDNGNVFNDCNPDSECSDYARDGYSCANAWNCNGDRKIITDGKGLIDVRGVGFTLDASDSKCPNEDQVCCLRPNFRAPPPDVDKPLVNKPLVLISKENEDFAMCGRSLDGHITITGGEKDQAQPTEFPHMCVLYRLDGGTRVYIGGASLIARNKVVTVAHKFKVDKSKGAEEVDLTNSVEQFSVRCGEYNVKADSKIYETQETMVAAVIFHPLYNPKTVKNNLAILRTKENFIYQAHIGPVCLPRPKESFELGSKGKDCWSSGWGANSFDGDKVYSDALKKVQLAVVPREECEERMRQTDRFKGKGFRLHESWMCMGGKEGEDTCSGDGGSPHVCRTDRGWMQVGAVAWGVECGTAVPAVYSSIPDAMCWIDYVMSCYGEAENSINNLDAGSFNLRGVGDTAESINAMSPIDCQAWMDNNVELGNRCTVIYGASIDERNVG